ncbi:MAG TPA: xanthine dehydrogenase family protein molybdopterin-binding subunit, partial [Marisediminicola sp.]|nr:xanthine dehydrogenase family protein molybdopterin-binding subunit [Marisediminicola sp.]
MAMQTEVPRVRPENYIGAKIRRTEDPRYLAGRATYIDDIHLPGMLHAAVLRSSEPHANITKLDIERAKALKGVHGVYTQEDIDPLAGPFVTTLPRPEVQTITRPPLDSRKVTFVGQPIAVVVADSRYIAEDGLDLIDVEYELLPIVMDAEKSLEPGAPNIRPEIPGNNFGHIEFQRGDVDGAFAEADHVFTKRFHQGRFTAAPLETRGVIGDYDGVMEELKVYSSTQLPHVLRTLLAMQLGIRETKLQVIAREVGGGFGLKAHMFDEEVIIPVISRLIGRPVKWIEDRYENLVASVHAKEQIVYLDVAVNADGTILAFRGRYIGVAGAWAPHPWTTYVDVLTAASLLPSFYAIKGVAYEVDAALTNMCPLGAYRGVGWTVGHNARELMLDDIARELEIDPVEFRLKNMIPDEPYTSATGMHYDGGSYNESIHKTMELIDYPALRERQKELREQGRYLGIGVSPYVEPTAWGSEGARANGFDTDYYDSASVTVEPDGSVLVTTGLHNHGQAHETTFAQVAADAIGVRFEDVHIRANDTTGTAYGFGTWCSRGAVIGSATITRAGKEVREKLIRMAAHVMEVSPEDVELYDGVATVKGVPDKSMTVAQISGFTYMGGAHRPAGVEPALTATRSYDPPETYSNGTTVAIVEVDPQTGVVKIERIVASEDCGVVLNPMVVDGQVQGAVAQGIGGVMYEQLSY